MTVMPTTVNGLRLRKTLGRTTWLVPSRFGFNGWIMDSWDRQSRVIATAASLDGTEWIHASISHIDRIPTYDDLALLHEAAFGDGWAYQVFAPPAHHVNIHEYALHLWGRSDGKPALPNFGEMGTI